MAVESRTDGNQITGWGNCWLWFIVALVLLLWVDLATTLMAADVYGLTAEANPIMRGLLGAGLSITLLIHGIVFLLATIGFAVIVRIGQDLEDRRARRYRRCCLGWIGVLLVIGLVVAANNLALVLIALIG